MAARYRAALVFRPDKEIHSTKLLKRGKVDPTQLYRWAVDDWRMFQQKGRKVDPSAYVYLLVDMSGSMGGEKLKSAQRLAKLFIAALSSMDGVTPKVYGHTGDSAQTSCDVYRIWEPGDPLSRNGLIMSLPHSNNYDGYAIELVGNKLAAESRNNEQRLLIVLSDGYPAGHNYGGTSAESHVRAVVDELRSKHRIRTLQIAIDDGMDPERQARMFDEFIPYRPGDSLDVVPRRLTKWLEKVL
jgi:cobalamin biosynthesis protein CobT